MTAYEQSMAELVRRVEALELSADVRANEVRALRDLVAKAGERVEALEAQLKDAFEDAYSRRRQRWHETYNASLRKIAIDKYMDAGVDSYTHSLGEAVEAAHRFAVMQADRAHGPLEVKAAAVIPPIEHASWKMFADPRVEALVRATQELVENIEPYTAPRHLTNIKSALKPFEDMP